MKRAHDDISDAAATGENSTENFKGRVKAEAQQQGDPNGDAAVETAQAPAPTTAADNGGVGSRRKCPYLDTINRNVLDFDFEKVIVCHRHRDITVGMQFLLTRCTRPFVHRVYFTILYALCSLYSPQLHPP